MTPDEVAPRSAPSGTTEVGLLDGLATTRSIRRYLPEALPEADLAAMLWHATRAPSGSNRQPVRYLVLRDDGGVAQEARVLIGGAARQVWATKMERDGYRQGSGSEPGSPKARTAATMQQYVDGFEHIPVVVLVCMVRYRDPSPYEGGSVYPAVQNLLLAARGLGYGGAVNMFHSFVEAPLRELLAIPDGVALSACVTLGRPAGHHGPVRRRPLADVVYDGEWGRAADWAADPDGTRHTAWRQHTDAPAAGQG